jgi:hypothetical protein
MDQSKIAHLNPQDYTHLPHAKQDFEAHEQTDVAIRPLVATLITIAVVIVVTVIGMWGFFNMLEYLAGKAPENQKFSDVETKGIAPRQVPAGMPELQGVPIAGANPNTPAKDTDEMRQKNAKTLAGQEGMRPGMQPGLAIDEAMNEALSKKIFKTAGAPASRPAAQ